LSREGVAAMATYIPAGMFGLGWMAFGRPDGWTAAMGLVASAGAVVTVACTAMIYASLKPVAQWHSRFTLPGYLVFSAMTGATILSALLCSFGIISKAAVVLAFAATLMGWTLKIATWNHNDTSKPRANANTATGLSGGQVRSVEWPHTEENYLLKEMGYRLARKHALRLRLVTQALAFAVPAALLGLGFVSEGVVAAAILIAAAVIQFAGMLIERWLFFAEARHSVVLYYGG
jgi:DMSO reductase anchor subunit